MKATTTALALSFATFLFSCEKPKEIDDGRPRIKSISIAGIAAEDIEFIPERYVINVKLPAVVPTGGLVPTFKLTDKTEIIKGLMPDGTFESSLFCGVNYLYSSIPRTIVVANDKMTAIYKSTTTYQINFARPSGCPEIIGDLPITYSRDSSSANFMYIHVPMKNAFSAFQVYTVNLKNLATGAVHQYGPLLNDQTLNACNSGVNNRVSLFFSPYWSNPRVFPGPGSFQLSISTRCGETNRILTFPQPLVFTE